MRPKRVSYYLLVILGLALLIRLPLASLPGFKVDIDAWFAWALRLNELGLANFYSPDIWTNYTPGYLYFLYLLGALKTSLNLNTDQFYYLLKLPAILADLGIGLILFNHLKQFSAKWAIVGLLAFLFNPVVLFNSAVWGQIDSVLTLYLLLSITWLSKNQLRLSALSFAIALLIKPQALALVPIFGLFFLNKKHLSQIPTFVSIFITIIIGLSLPYFTNDLTKLPQLFISMVNDYSYTSLFAYNFWGVVGFWLNDQIKFASLTYHQWGLLAYGSYWLMIIYLFFKRNLSFFSLATLATLGFCFLPTRVHERYLYMAFPFLIIIACQFKSRLLLIATGLLNLIHLANLYYVYLYYNEVFYNLPKILYWDWGYQWLDHNGQTLSFISCIIFIILFFAAIKHVQKSK